MVSANGIETDPAKREKIQKLPVQTNPDELRSLLAFAGHYKKYVKNFSTLVKPLFILLQPTSVKKVSKTGNSMM